MFGDVDVKVSRFPAPLRNASVCVEKAEMTRHAGRKCIYITLRRYISFQQKTISVCRVSRLLRIGIQYLFRENQFIKAEVAYMRGEIKRERGKADWAGKPVREKGDL